MKISDFGLDLIMAFEGFYAQPYRCPAGVLTQGFGHTASAGPPALGGTWTRAYAADVLRKTVAERYAAPVSRLLKRRPKQSQFDAMVSLAYNIGLAAFGRSSVLRYFNAGDDKRAVAAFSMWVKGGGKILPGLVRRRASEALVYQGVRDLDFDGKRDPNEPAYGDTAQAVESIEAPSLPPATVTPLKPAGGSSGGAGASGSWDSPAAPAPSPVAQQAAPPVSITPLPAPTAPAPPVTPPLRPAPAPPPTPGLWARFLDWIGWA